MKYSQPLYLLFPIQSFQIISSIIAFFHMFLVERKWVKVSDIVFQSPEGLNKTIKAIWFSRMFRRFLSLVTRTPLRSKVIKLVKNELVLPKSGCVITIPHTPWARLLAEWCRSSKFALVVAGGPWIRRTGDINVPGVGISSIRKAVTHLKSNGYVVIVGDNENRSPYCKVTYLGKVCNGALLPVRLASLATVPIVTVIPKFDGKQINLHKGLTFEHESIKQNEQLVLQQIFSFFETEIYAAPYIFMPFILGSLNK